MERLTTSAQIDRLKRRRDRLVNRAATPDEQQVIFAEIRSINRRIDALHRGLGHGWRR